MSDDKPIVQVVKEKVQSAIDAANQMTRDFIETHRILPNAEASEKEIPSKPTALDAMRKQGRGFHQGIIE